MGQSRSCYEQYTKDVYKRQLSSIGSVVFSPTGLLIGGVAAGVALIVTHWDDIKKAAKNVAKWVGEKWDDVKKWTSEKWGKISKNLSDTWSCLLYTSQF